MLPIALNRATRVLAAVMKAPKEYVCVMKLHGEVDIGVLKLVLTEFTGPIYQRPPLRSAVKRVIRIRRIYSIEMLEVKNTYVLLKVKCEAGTYIRKLVHDIGMVLGCGAHMQELRRIKAGPFTEEEHLVTLHDLKDAYDEWIETGDDKMLRKVILPVEKAVEHLPFVVIRDSAVDAICHGASLATPGILRVETGIKVGTLVAIFTQKGELVALGKALMRSEEMVSSRRGIAVKPTCVVMKPGIYPPLWKRKTET